MTSTAHNPNAPMGCQHTVRDEKGALLRCAGTATQRTQVVGELPGGNWHYGHKAVITYHFWCTLHVPADEVPAPTTDEEMADD